MILSAISITSDDFLSSGMKSVGYLYHLGRFLSSGMILSAVSINWDDFSY
jgi:hypothetical protein